MSGQNTATLNTATAIEAVAWGRAPRCVRTDGTEARINRRVVCADGFKVSLQASANHYANDSHESGEAAYWRLGDDDAPVYPFTTFEVGNPSEDLDTSALMIPYDSAGVWAWVPRAVCTALLDVHGGAIAWEATR